MTSGASSRFCGRTATSKGREDDAIRKTVLAQVDSFGDLAPFFSSMEQHADLGISHVQR